MPPSELVEGLSLAANWLIEIRDQGSGGWGEYAGARVNSLNTAEAILALVAAGRAAGDEVIQRGSSYLVSQQLKAGENQGAWTRSVVRPDGERLEIPDTIRCALAMLALHQSGTASGEAPMVAGLTWLQKARNVDGGWGYTVGQPSRLYPTCLVLQAALCLLEAGGLADSAALRETVRESLAAVVANYARRDGSFGNQAGLEMVHTLSVLKVLTEAQVAGFSVAPKVLDKARRWARQRPAEVTRWSNETVDFGRDGAGSYTFTHITPALYLDTMSDDPLTSKATRESLMVIADNREEQTGAFGSKRPVSWSTSKTLCGLAAVRDTVQKFPEREAPERPLSGRVYLLLSILFLAVVATVASIVSDPSPEYMGLMALAILALLLVYSALSESAFVELVKSVFPGDRGKGGS